MKHFSLIQEQIRESIDSLKTPITDLLSIHSIVDAVFDRVQCCAVKRNGDRCSSLVKDESLCGIHLKKKNSKKCEAILKSGKNKGNTCSLSALPESIFCKRHQATEEPFLVNHLVEEEEIVEQTIEEENIGESNEEDIIEEDITEQPLEEEDITEQPLEEEDITEQPVEEEDITEQPVEEEDITEQPVEEEDITEQPVEEDISQQPVEEDIFNRSRQEVESTEETADSQREPIQDMNSTPIDTTKESQEKLDSPEEYEPTEEKVAENTNVATEKIPLTIPNNTTELEQHLKTFEKRLAPFAHLPYFSRESAILIEKDLWKLRRENIRRGYTAEDLFENDRIIDPTIDMRWRGRSAACIYFNPRLTEKDMKDGKFPICAKRRLVDGFFCAEHVDKKNNTELYPWLTTPDPFDPLKIWTPRIHRIIDGNGLWYYENFGFGAKTTKKGFVAISSLVDQGRWYQEMGDMDVLKCHNAGLLYKRLTAETVHRLYEIPHDLEPLEGKGFTSFEQLLVERPQLYIKYWNIWNSRIEEVQNYKKVYGKMNILQLFKKIRSETLPDWVKFEEDFRYKGLNHMIIPPPSLQQASDPTFHPLFYCWSWMTKHKQTKMFVLPPYYIEYPLPTEEDRFIPTHPDEWRIKIKYNPWMTFHYNLTLEQWKDILDRRKRKHVDDSAYYVAIRSPNKYWLEHYDPQKNEVTK